MRIAIISDVHGNLHALRAVLEDVAQRDVDDVVCAGDVVGYGARPNECCRAVSELARQACLGNHDLAAIRADPSGMNPCAARAALWTSEHLDDDSKKYLEGLGESVRFRTKEMQWVVRHGSLGGIWEYLYEQDVDEGMLRDARAQVLVFGHTHVPYLKRFSLGIIINPGSVGQPRDGDPRASYSMLDVETLLCNNVRVEYDVEGAAEAILEAGLPEMLATRLSSGF